ncbi:hypothetical protein HY639_05470 [Candidatus Woesearchaeota archaeon]|nr:hypothetical protein [Candidatus Woesearchaeota archaeon]
MKIPKVQDFSLQHTLESGQFFMYEQHGEWYYLVTTQHVCKVRQTGTTLEFHNISRDDISQLLGLAVPYTEIIMTLSRDPIIRRYIDTYPGLRVMRQDPWQCTISFLCSSASNIPRIRKNLFALCRAFGRKVVYDKRPFYLFPTLGSLGPVKVLQRCGVGFRAPYLAAANKLPQSFFSSLRLLPYTEAKQHLLEVSGIGEKIADCILLFAYNKWDAFPVDVWIQRALDEQYGGADPQSLFPSYAGYAQQFLYHGFRTEKR